VKRIVLDLETNSLHNYSVIHCAVAIDIDTGEIYEYVGENVKRLPDLLDRCSLVVGHNFCNFDWGVLVSLLGYTVKPERVCDTLILSRLLNYNIDDGHSLEAWGKRLGIAKTGLDISFDVYSPEMLKRCVNDCKINKALYLYLMKPTKVGRKDFKDAIEVEHKMAFICNQMHQNGFRFDIDGARKLYEELTVRVAELDQVIWKAFPPKAVEIRTVTPKATKFGTINRSDFRWYDGGDLSKFTINAPFTLFKYESFNPGSTKQVVERLNQAGWKPVNKTTGHIEAERDGDKERLAKFRISGWKVDEENLATLPDTAPEGARKLVERLLLAARLRTLDEWFAAYNPNTGRIHGTVVPLGTYTHRASHKNPNTGNIAAEKSIKYKGPKLKKLATDLGGRMRSMWIAPEDKVLVGTDAEGIQLRIFAHYINDPLFTKALISGKKETKDDPHSLNAHILRCSRDTAKTFIFAYLLGAGDRKTGEILGRSVEEGRDAKSVFVRSYPGLGRLKAHVIPRDAERGYTQAIDGRLIACDDEHLMMAVYLQSGEAILMKHANVMWQERLIREGIWFKQVGWVHDEYITEAHKDDAEYIGFVQREAIRLTGERLKLNCPMSGETKIGKNWLQAH